MGEPINIPLGTSDYRRTGAKEASFKVVNRYFESNPTNTTNQAALLSRPGLKIAYSVGTGPIRALYTQSGSFDDALFVVSGSELYRIDHSTGASTLILSGVAGSTDSSYPEMVSTGSIGSVPEYLFFADGALLYVYLEDGYARGHLTASGNASDGDQVRIDNTYYQFVTSGVDTGTPDGSAANPWKVLIGVTSALSLNYLYHAINASTASGVVVGTQYSTATTAHATCTAYAQSTTNLYVRHRLPGSPYNSTVTTETSATLAWDAATLANGGTPSITQVAVPDDLGILSLAYIAGYVICVPVQGQDVNGRFFWIDPGETTINPLNYATAERLPDAINAVRTVGDNVIFFGQDSAEAWYPTGTLAAPFRRAQGRTFDHGTWGGTATQIRDATIVVDNHGVVWKVEGGSVTRISDHSIEQRTLSAIKAARLRLLI